MREQSAQEQGPQKSQGPQRRPPRMDAAGNVILQIPYGPQGAVPGRGTDSGMDRGYPGEERREARREGVPGGYDDMRGGYLTGGAERREAVYGGYAGVPGGYPAGRAERRKTVRESIRVACSATLIFVFVFLLVWPFADELIVDFILARPEFFPHLQTTDQLLDVLDASGIPGIASDLCAVLLLFLFYLLADREVLPRMMDRHERMSAGLFIGCAVMAIGLNLVVYPIDFAFEHLFNLFGYTMEAEVSAASDAALSLSMVVYGDLFAPVFEELVFRGMILQSLKRHGRVFAIVLSALLFGLMHGNLTQFFFAGLMGLILGYLAMEYSIGWSIALHIFNNLFADLETWGLDLLPERAAEITGNFISISTTAVGVALLLWYGRRILQYRKRNASHPGTWGEVFTSPWFWALAAASAAEIVLGLEAL